LCVKHPSAGRSLRSQVIQQQSRMASRVQVGGSSASAFNKNSFEHTHIFDKTRLCKFYVKGKCKRGQACTFAHGDVEVQPQPDFFRTQLCAGFVRSGMCELGSGCKYAHSAQELRRAKTHKAGKSQSQCAKKVAAADTTTTQVSFEVQRLEVVRLQTHLNELQTITGPPVPVLAPPPGASRPRKVGIVSSKAFGEESEDSERMVSASDFSRQSTEEGIDPSLCFSRVTTKEDCETWDDMTSAASSSDAVEGLGLPLRGPPREYSQEQEMPCEVLVKHTFINLREVHAGSHRRTKSVPAAKRLVPGIDQVSL